VKQYLFYQHNVQQFFIAHLGKYQGVVVPLSIATSFPDGTHGFLRALLAKDSSKEFMIDPRTPLFQKHWDRKSIRPPHEKMAGVSGAVVKEGLKSPIAEASLTLEALTNATQATIAYQRSFRYQGKDQKKLDKYKALMGGGELPEITNPQLLLPPYFEFSAPGDPWFSATINCTSIACGLEGVLPQNVRPILHFREFDFEDWSQATEKLAALKIKTVFLYPNDFHELEASPEVLARYTSAIKQFSAAGLLPFALHGGYFAVCMSKVGLMGFGNGVGYGEWRDSGYHRGGTAEKRIYIPKLHRFLEPAKAQALLDTAPDYFGEDSDLLAECVESNRPLNSILLAEALDHFMECRSAELQFVANSDIAAIEQRLSDTQKVLKEKSGLIGQEVGKHLGAWREALATW